MPFILDGHNLIPHIPGLSLSDPDDEQSLIRMVQEYCRIRRKQAEIYFDHAPPGFTGQKQFGTVKVKFARLGRIADQEIKERLETLGKTARNWTVVSSDREVGLAAKALRAQVVSSEVFAQDLRAALQPNRVGTSTTDEPAMSEDELAEWLQLFQNKKNK